MANKLPWFTHDHNARNDDFIRRAEDEFGPFGYSAWFKLIEIIHEHGTGDILYMKRHRLAAELRSRWGRVRLYLELSRTSGKVEYELSGEEVRLKIKKFRDRQSKLKSNLPATFRQPSANLPIEREGQRDRENGLAPAALDPGGISKPKERTPIHLIMRAFKEAKGIDANDAEWDRKHFKRFARAAADIQKIFGTRIDDAIDYVLAKGDEFDTQHLEGWGLEGIARAAATDPRAQNLSKENGGENGFKNGTVGADRMVREGRGGITASAGSLAGDALRALESDALRAEKSAALAGLGEDQIDDDAPFA